MQYCKSDPEPTYTLTLALSFILTLAFENHEV